jgi:hypothetical protein
MQQAGLLAEFVILRGRALISGRPCRRHVPVLRFESIDSFVCALPMLAYN